MSWVKRAALVGTLFAALAGAVVLMAPAASASSVVGGQFCSNWEHGMVKQDAAGKWRRCEKNGRAWRWSAAPVAAPTPNATCVSAKPSVSTSKSASASASASVSASATVAALPAKLPTCTSTPPQVSTSPSSQAGGGLALTGPKTGVIAAIGAILVAGGAGIYLIGKRRRRTKFVA